MSFMGIKIKQYLGKRWRGYLWWNHANGVEVWQPIEELLD